MKLRPLLAAASLAAILAPAFADSVITMQRNEAADPQTGGEATVETSTIWIGEGRIRENQPEQSVIVDTQAAKLYVLRHAEKAYFELQLPIVAEKLMPRGMLDAMRKQAEQMEMQIEIVPADETRTIAGFPAKRFDVRMSNSMGMRMQVELWTSTALGLDIEAYKDLTRQMTELQAFGSEWVSEILAIEGFPVLRETTVTLGERESRTREELVSVERRDAPEGTYAPPADYKLEPLDFTPQRGG